MDVRRVNIADLDALLKDLQVIKRKRDSLKKLMDDETSKLEETKGILMKFLEATKRDSYSHPDFGTVSLVRKMSVATPKTLDEKRLVKSWLFHTEGPDAPDTYMSFNSRTLNSFYNEKLKEYAERGEVLDIPGLTPTEYTQVVYRK